MTDLTTDGKRWVSAPAGSELPTTGGVTGVHISPGETVQWIWTHGPGGSYVSGYTIIRGLDSSNWGESS